MPETKTEYALNAFGPDGAVIAQSWDGGGTWKQTKAGKALTAKATAPVPRTFSRRIAAVVDELTPSIARRIETPWAIMREAGILAGWAPFQHLTTLQEGDLDAIIVPGLRPLEDLEALSRVGKTLLLDLDAPLVWTEADRQLLFATLDRFQGVTVPTEIMANRLRPYHERVFVVPHLLRRELWKGQGARPRKAQVTIAYPEDPVLEAALARLSAKFGDRLDLRPFDWASLYPQQEPLAYSEYDIVCLPPPPDRYQASLAPVLPAMAAQSVLVADVHWPLLKHRENGIVIPKHVEQKWADELNALVYDGRLRLRIGRLAMGTASRMVPEVKAGQVFLPYRVLVPEGPRVQYV